jgi:mycofactocin system glycosyltransferase
MTGGSRAGGRRAGAVNSGIAGAGGSGGSSPGKQSGGSPPGASTVPAGFGIALDPGGKQLDDSTFFGGSPARVLRLTRAGQRALAELRAGPVRSTAGGTLARRLTDAGLAHPRPPELAAAPDVTVLIPARDRPELLDRCLTALGRRYPVVVVDDGSRNPAAVADVAARHRATLLVRAVNGGPAAARNTGLADLTSELVAFCDSDCVPESGWIDRLAAHLADPAVAVAAPRIRPVPGGRSWADRYTAAGSSLDMGGQEGRVAPGTRLSYVPTAALLARRAALLAVAAPAVFDPELRLGEDVDLVWRLHAAGWRIRYEPAAVVRHHEPASWPGLLARRFRYGTSAAPLALRHPGQSEPLLLYPWPALTVAGLLARRPVLAGLGFAGSVLAMRAALHRAGLPDRGVLPAMLRATQQTWLGVGRYGGQFSAPVLAAALAAPGGRPARRWGRRAAAASLLLGPALTAWSEQRPDLDPVRFALGHLADDVAYGAGVWTGAVRARTTIPVRPVIAWHPLRGNLARPGASGPGAGPAG